MNLKMASSLLYCTCFLVLCLHTICESRQVSLIDQRDLIDEEKHHDLKEKNFVIESSPAELVKPSDSLSSAENVHPKRHLKKHKKKSQKHKSNHETGKKLPWHYCVDGSNPKLINYSENPKGIMCQREYPSHSCCTGLDLTFDLLGSKTAERISNERCVNLLKQLRCAHCSPRSWWLFHSSDHHRLPHKRFFPLLCPSFCRKFHAACRDSIAGFQNERFCEFHTSSEEGPCFPDYKVRKGTID